MNYSFLEIQNKREYLKVIRRTVSANYIHSCIQYMSIVVEGSGI